MAHIRKIPAITYCLKILLVAGLVECLFIDNLALTFPSMLFFLIGIVENRKTSKSKPNVDFHFVGIPDASPPQPGIKFRANQQKNLTGKHKNPVAQKFYNLIQPRHTAPHPKTHGKPPKDKS